MIQLHEKVTFFYSVRAYGDVFDLTFDTGGDSGAREADLPQASTTLQLFTQSLCQHFGTYFGTVFARSIFAKARSIKVSHKTVGRV